jgi:nitroreductase
MQFDLNQTDTLLSTTRAVRKRLDLDRPVARETILECLQLATQAPTGSNRQGWRWLVVTDPETRKALGELYRRGGEAYLAQAVKDATPGTQDHRVFESAYYLLERMGDVPVHVVPCSEGRPPHESMAYEAGYWGSICPAIWSFQLALRSRGLGSVWTTLHLVYEKEAAELLGIPADVTQAALIPVAHTVGTDFKPAKRPPVSEVTYLDRWGKEAD